MTHDELVQVARHGTYVRWTKSGVIEYVWSNKKGSILARGVFTRRHFIGRVDEKTSRMHHCELVLPTHMITLGEQYEAARATPWFRGNV